MNEHARRILQDMRMLQQQLRGENRNNRNWATQWQQWALHAIYDTYPEYFPSGDLTLKQAGEKIIVDLDRIENQYAADKPGDLVQRCRQYANTYIYISEITSLKNAFCSLIEERLNYQIRQMQGLVKLSHKHGELTALNQKLQADGRQGVDDPYAADTREKIRKQQQQLKMLKALYAKYLDDFGRIPSKPSPQTRYRLEKLLDQAYRKLKY